MISHKKKISYILFPILSLLIFFLIFYFFIVDKINKFQNLNIQSTGLVNKYIKLRNVNINYIEKGKEGNNILFLHGLGGNTSTFRYCIEKISKNNKIYALDLKGFGYSERPLNSNYSLEEQAKILLEFLNKKNITKVIAVGHSMGGEITLLAYNMNPEKFSKIILIDSSGLENSPRFLLKFINQPIVDVIYYNLFNKESSFRKVLRTLFFDDTLIDKEVVQNYYTPFKIENSNKAYLNIMKGFKRYNISDILVDISIPTLVIWGENDTWIDVKYGYKFNKLIKNSKLEIIPEVGHLCIEEKHDITNKIIEDFINEELKFHLRI